MLLEAPHPDAAPSPPSEDHAEHRWRVAAVSVRGAGHDRTGQPCQDAHCWELLPGGILAAAVADGAGSAGLAEVGALVAARAAVAALRDAAAGEDAPAGGEWPAILAGALEAARAAVEGEADRRGVPRRELASTLIVLAATPERVAAAHVGDGAVVVADDSGDLAALALPQNGEYANETTFLTSPAALERASITLWRGRPARIAAFSDGLQRLALCFPSGAPHAPFFSPLFRFIAETADGAAAQAQLAAFLGSGRVRARADDDLTLLLAALDG